MAMSNWTLLAFDNEGAPCSGEAEFPSGLRVELYKNWVYLHHPQMWTENQSFVSDTIAQVNSGDLNIGGVNIIVERFRGNGIDYDSAAFVLATYQEWSETPQFFAGIVDYGYVGEDYIGLSSDTYQHFLTWIDAQVGEYSSKARKAWVDKVHASNGLSANQGDLYFSQVIGTDSQAVTPGDTPPEPIFMKLLDKAFPENETE
jgi:hypothetical protein